MCMPRVDPTLLDALSRERGTRWVGEAGFDAFVVPAHLLLELWHNKFKRLCVYNIDLTCMIIDNIKGEEEQSQ